MQEAFDLIKERLEEKIKVTSLEIIVTGTKAKPYFEIRYKEVGKKDYSIGYSSYDLNNVFEWKEECFEIVNQVAEEYKSNDDLISRSALIKALTNVEVSFYLEDGQTSDTYDGTTIVDIIEEQPTVSINDGWILCSVKMPEEPEIGMRDIECLQEYNVMIEGADAATTLYYAGDGEWYDFITESFYKVIAWQPLPEPYQPKICVNTDCCYNQKSECPASAGCPGYEEKT